MRRSLSVIFGTSLALGLGSGPSASESRDWPQFLGPSRDGRAADRRLVSAWLERGLRERFRVAVGAGYSGVVTGAGRLFSHDDDGRDEYVFALSQEDGRELWRRRLGRSPRGVYGGTGPRATPSVSGGRVYAVGMEGTLVALETRDGSVLWRRDLADLGWRTPAEGAAASPLVAGARLYVAVGGDSGRALAALDPASGRTLWTAGDDRIAYASPVLWRAGGVAQVLFLGATRLAAFDLATGQPLWIHPWETYDGVNAATPLPAGADAIFLSAGYDQGAILLRAPSREESVPRVVWRSRVMKNHFNNSVYLDGTLYGFDGSNLQAVDATTGESLWRQRGLGKGSLIAAAGHLIVLSENGELVLLEARREAYTERARHQVLHGRSWTPPSLGAGRLYVRNRSELVCLE